MTNSLPSSAPEPDFSHRQLTPQQHRVINLLAAGVGISEAAAQTGLHRNTIHHWARTVPAFKLEMQAAAHEQTLLLRETTRALFPKAFEAVAAVLNDEQASLSLKLRAAALIFKLGAEPVQKQSKTDVPSFEEQLVDRVDLTSEEFAQKCTIVNPAPVQTIRKAPEPGRNSVCLCGSGMKFKRCCANRAHAAPME